MTVLDTIKNVLDGLLGDPNVQMQDVWYGACRDRSMDLWNYFVFNRSKTVKSSNNVDLETYYEVHIVHEDYIPEGYVETVIAALEGQKVQKLRATSETIRYDYTFKGATDMVVEIATITFVHPEKRQ